MDQYTIGRMDEPTRRRRRTTTLELEILETEFAKCDKPSISERDRISDVISRTDIDGPGMNGREIQVWFQNKRQAIRRAQGAYPLCEPMSERAKTRLANEQLFGIKLDPSRQDDTTPPGSFTSPEESSSSQNAGTPFTVPRYGLTTPKSSLVIRDRRAQLVLSDTGDGHAEVMFSPTPLKPSSPPRVPLLITPIRTPLSRKIAARSASSPALLALRTPTVSKGNDAVVQDSTDAIITTTPLQATSTNTLGSLKSLKRSHSLISSPNVHKTKESQAQQKRQHASKTITHAGLGRGKENIPPLSSFTMPQQANATQGPSGDSYGRDIRRIQSENLGQSWSTVPASSPSVAMRTTPMRLKPSIMSSSPKSTTTREAQTLLPKKMSAEECALSLVSLAHGG